MPFHINPDTGDSGTCSATVRSCKYAKDGEIPPHYATAKEAESAYEAANSSNTITSLTNSNKDGKLSAEISAAYAEWSLLNDHLHNGSDVGNHAELSYYSSPAGLLELQRRMLSEEKGSGYDRHHQIFDKIQEAGKPKKLELTEEEKERLKIHLDKSAEKIQRSIDSEEIDFDNFNRVDRDLGAYLIKHSSDWLSKLSPEEQEIISHTTSNGFYLIEAAMGNKEITSETKRLIDEMYADDLEELESQFKMTSRSSEKKWAEYDAAKASFYNSKARAFADKFRKTLESAPILDQPIKTYRGVKLHELDKAFGTTENERKELVEKLISGEMNGTKLSRTSSDGSASKLANGAISTTVNPGRSLTFCEHEWMEDHSSREYIYEIEARTMASPVAVSAWGIGEAEVFTNPNSDYEITGAYMQLEEKSRTESQFIVIKLKEIINQ